MKKSKVATGARAALDGDQADGSHDLLYHYTTQNGLLGILKDQCIWASHYRYLNDLTEGLMMSKFLDLFCATIKTTATPKARDSDRKTLSRARSLSNEIKRMIASHDAFVTSFSVHGDLLSQWRAYAGPNGGFSIGFDRTRLKGLATNFISQHTAEFYDDIGPLLRCNYVSSNGEPLSIGEADPQPRTFAAEEEELQDLPKTMLRAAVTSKHASFKEEAEWRMAFVLREKARASAVKFRAGSSMPIPYLEIPFASNRRLVAISKIIVGPCPHPDEAIHAVELLLKKHEIHGVSVKPSKVPYRNW